MFGDHAYLRKTITQHGNPPRATALGINLNGHLVLGSKNFRSLSDWKIHRGRTVDLQRLGVRKGRKRNRRERGEQATSYHMPRAAYIPVPFQATAICLSPAGDRS